MAQINFDWKNPDEGMGFVSSKASLMQDYELKDVETLPFLFKKYDPSAYKAVLDTLIPENAMVVLSHNLAETDSKAPYYDAEYSLKKIGGKSFIKLSNPEKVSGIFYPAKNDFIPYNLNLVEEYPHLVQDNDRGKVWFKYDHRFKQPKIALTFRIETPKVYGSPKNLELAKLYEAMMQEGLNELVSWLASQMPNGPFLFDPNEISDSQTYDSIESHRLICDNYNRPYRLFPVGNNYH